MNLENIMIEARSALAACNVAADALQELVSFAEDAECETLSDYVRMTSDESERLCADIAHYNAVSSALYETARTMGADAKALDFLLHVDGVCDDYAHFAHDAKCTIEARADHEKSSRFWRLDNVNELSADFWHDFQRRAENTPERLKIANYLFTVYVGRTRARLHYSIYELDGCVYICASRAPIITTCKQSSREGDGYSLRFVPSKTQKRLLVPYSLKLCSVSDFAQFCAENAPYNRGECAEMLLKKILGYPAEKDASAFWAGCDIEAECASVKFENASIINEKTAKRVAEIFNK